METERVIKELAYIFTSPFLFDVWDFPEECQEKVKTLFDHYDRLGRLNATSLVEDDYLKV